MKQTISCPHDDGNVVLFIYDIDENVEIHLCQKCHRNLSGEMLKELAKKAFKEEER